MVEFFSNQGNEEAFLLRNKNTASALGVNLLQEAEGEVAGSAFDDRLVDLESQHPEELRSIRKRFQEGNLTHREYISELIHLMRRPV